jgi:hypothetical protein
MFRLSLQKIRGGEVLLRMVTPARGLAFVPAAITVAIFSLAPAPTTPLKPTQDLVQETPRPWPLLLPIIIIVLLMIPSDNSIRGTKSWQRHGIIFLIVTICNSILPKEVTPWNLAICHKFIPREVIEGQIFDGIDVNENFKHMGLLHLLGPHEVYLHTTPFRL